ncbi:MAG: glycosyltransferase [Candidatus Thermoplasmatota archaeon]|nr:glycosyltransferase family 2 protein [Euryarchaeota archaeon]MBU4144031.1 glycosyltransferase [Candidatus Thermoplasmatota archaeon]MBU4591855.1 glycosyltransferase [Candidatus Thermoplasmatota archaeon]
MDCKMLERLIDSALSQKQRFSFIIVVDDKSPLQLNYQSDKVQYLQMKKNSGPAAARNVGIKYALENDCDYYLFTDHDCILDKEWNKEMTSFLARTEFGAVGGMTYVWGNTLLDYYHGINGTLAGKWLLPEKKELWYMPSLNFGMKRHVTEEFPFDERFPTAAGEDVDVCLRLRSKYKIGFCPRAKLWHDFGYKNTINDFSRFVRLFMKYKSSSATVYEGHTVLMWDSSVSIYEGNMYESNL